MIRPKMGNRVEKPQPQRRASTKAIGAEGEAAAAAILEAQGYRIVDRNVWVTLDLEEEASDWKYAQRTAGRAEIDIIAWDGDALCFIEVKTRRFWGGTVAEPATSRIDRQTFAEGAAGEAVTPQKQRLLARAATAYAARYGFLDDDAVSLRFDVVAVTDSHSPPSLPTETGGSGPVGKGWTMRIWKGAFLADM